MWPFTKKYKFRELSESEIKERTRILIIDDDPQYDLINYCEKHGWKLRYTDRLQSFDDTEIVDSHIICIDINGVGLELGKKSGLDVALSIKTKYSAKKVVIYSTKPISEFFHPVNEILDRRIFKQGDYEPFISTFKEFATDIFSWNNIVRRFYDKVHDHLPANVSLSVFEQKMNQIPSKELEISPAVVAKLVGLSIPIIKEFIPLLTNGLQSAK